LSHLNDSWDVVIVGARCSGATLATLLARQDLRVLVLEATASGSDMPMSTHYLQPPGMGVLDRLGIGDKVRAVTPATRAVRGAMDDAEFVAPLVTDHFAYCVRRCTLDPWLQEAAQGAGAEIRFHHRVLELVKVDGRVTGVIAQGPAGKETHRVRRIVRRRRTRVDRATPAQFTMVV
jgi:flavin-dependent dehydrogenase